MWEICRWIAQAEKENGKNNTELHFTNRLCLEREVTFRMHIPADQKLFIFKSTQYSRQKATVVTFWMHFWCSMLCSQHTAPVLKVYLYLSSPLHFLCLTKLSYTVEYYWAFCSFFFINSTKWGILFTKPKNALGPLYRNSNNYPLTPVRCDFRCLL